MKYIRVAMEPCLNVSTITKLNKCMESYSIYPWEDQWIVTSEPIEEMINLSTLNLLCLKLEPFYNRFRYAPTKYLGYDTFSALDLSSYLCNMLSYLRITDKGELTFICTKLPNLEFIIEK